MRNVQIPNRQHKHDYRWLKEGWTEGSVRLEERARAQGPREKCLDFGLSKCCSEISGNSKRHFRAAARCRAQKSVPCLTGVATQTCRTRARRPRRSCSRRSMS